MNEKEENVYKEIKKELLQSVIDKKVDTYFTNKNELSHYYNVGKMIVDAQGGVERAKYGDGLIKRISERLSLENIKGYSTRSLKYIRKFYLFQKVQPLVAQLSWSHYTILLSLDNNNEIKYYIEQSTNYHWSKRELQKHIKNNDYQRLDDEAKNKLISQKKLNIYDNIKNPLIVNTFNDNKENISEKVLKAYILKDMDNFLEQLGDGFSYIKSEYKIMIGNIPNYIDMLLYNVIYNCYVIVELKVIQSRKDHLGQIQVYMNYIDKHIKTVTQNKTIGIIDYKKDNKYLIEYSSDDRIKITTYELV